jgi:hypothetical protein
MQRQRDGEDDGQGWLPLDADAPPIAAEDEKMTDEQPEAPMSSISHSAHDASMPSIPNSSRSENAVNGLMTQQGRDTDNDVVTASSSPSPSSAAALPPLPSASHSLLAPGAASPLPPLLRQKTEFIQRLSLATTDRLPCTGQRRHSGC